MANLWNQHIAAEKAYTEFANRPQRLQNQTPQTTAPVDRGASQNPAAPADLGEKRVFEVNGQRFRLSRQELESVLAKYPRTAGAPRHAAASLWDQAR
jgi:hypothetical protein